MEISEQAATGEDSILRNISETRKLWTEAATTKNTKMLQPGRKVFRKGITRELYFSLGGLMEDYVVVNFLSF